MHTDPNTHRGRRLAELRDDQRRHLWAVPENLFERLRWTSVPPATPTDLDRIDLELYVRDAAETRLTADARAWLEAQARYSSAEWCHAAVGLLTGEYVKEIKDELSLEFVDVAPEPKAFTATDDPVVRSLLAFLMLATVADVVAADDHADVPEYASIA